MFFSNEEDRKDYEAALNGSPPPSGRWFSNAYMEGEQTVRKHNDESASHSTSHSTSYSTNHSDRGGGGGIGVAGAIILFIGGLYVVGSIIDSKAGQLIAKSFETGMEYIQKTVPAAYERTKKALIESFTPKKPQSYVLLPKSSAAGSAMKVSQAEADIPLLGVTIGPTPWQENYDELATSAKGRGIVGLAMTDIAKSKRVAATIVTIQDTASTRLSYLLPPAGKLSKQYNILTCAAGTWDLDKSGKSIKNDLAIFPVPAAGTVVKKPQIKHRIVSGEQDCKTILTQQAEAQYGKVRIINQFAQPQ